MKPMFIVICIQCLPKIIIKKTKGYHFFKLIVNKNAFQGLGELEVQPMFVDFMSKTSFLGTKITKQENCQEPKVRLAQNGYFGTLYGHY